MKSFRIIVSLRLAIFSLIFNLSFAQEVNVDGGNIPFGTSMDGDEESYVRNEQDTQDPSLPAFQNDEDIIFFGKIEDEEAEVIFNEDEDIKILSPSDSSFETTITEQDIQDSSDALGGQDEIEPQNIDLPNLIISEVYRLGNDEWIEITNLSDEDFSGKITISGAKSSEYSKKLNISGYASIILADKQEIGLINDEIIAVNNASFSLTDSNAIGISLLYSGNIIDTFDVEESVVNSHKNKTPRPSFQKIYDNGRGLEITTSVDIYNITGFVANPGIIVIQNGNPWEGEGPSDYSSTGDTGELNQGTGNDTGSGNNSENPDSEQPLEIIDCSGVQGNIMTIDEIYRGGSSYYPYIEFNIHKDIQYEYDSLLLSGSLLAHPISVDLNDPGQIYFNKDKLQKNTRLILTTSPGALTEDGLITIVLQPDLEFNSSAGYLELYSISGQSRQLLDIVKITTQSSEKSNYHSGPTHQCGAVMDNVKDFSPGFDESFLKYISATLSCNETVVEVIKYVGGGGSCSCPSREELCGNTVQTGDVEITPQPTAAPLTGSENSPLTGGVSQSDEGGDSQESLGGQAIKILSLEPKNPESITLQSFLPYDIDFKNHKYYLKTSTATTKKYIDGILHANTIDTFTKNFGFLDAGACVYLYSGDNQLDSYCYSSEKIETEKEKQESDIFNPSDYQLSITHINYNPDGNDGGNETITIKSNSSKTLDLSKIKMKVNETNKKISGTIEPYSSITLKGSFGFPNSTKDGSDVVVVLFYDNHIFSTYRYNPNKPKVEIPDGAVKVYSVVDGDTFRYRKEDGSLQSVRLLGVDAPESNTARYRTTECFGKEAKTYLTNLIKNQYVTIEFDLDSPTSDAYGRMLAYVYLDGKLVNETLIAEGYAKEYTYKTAYTHQSKFKQAEEKAKKSEKGLRSSSICGKSIEEEPEARGIDYEKLSLKISNIIYDPEGTDEGNELVQLNVDNSQISSVSSIDFSDDFNLIISPRSEYATGTTKTKKLSEFGPFDISSSSEIALKGNFGLPNNRATCVSLNQGSYTFDTLCYNPNQILSGEEIVSLGDSSIVIPNVKIKSITPNPSGKDSGKEEIILLRTPSDNFPESLGLLDLSSDFSLLINDKTKKKLVGKLTPNQNITIKGSFSLPNSASCVSLLHQGNEVDKFCYGKASDGIKFNSDNTRVHEISAEELAIVKKITLVKQGDKLCTSYNKTIFTCKSIPNSTTEKNKKQLSMQNNFISELENYIKSNYSTIYYDSKLKDYFNLYSEAKKAIKSGSGDFNRNDSNISITNISTLFSSEYEQNAKDVFISQIQSFLPENISSLLYQIENQYSTQLVEKSDLNFLSLTD